MWLTEVAPDSIVPFTTSAPQDSKAMGVHCRSPDMTELAAGSQTEQSKVAAYTVSHFLYKSAYLQPLLMQGMCHRSSDMSQYLFALQKHHLFCIVLCS